MRIAYCLPLLAAFAAAAPAQEPPAGGWVAVTHYAVHMRDHTGLKVRDAFLTPDRMQADNRAEELRAEIDAAVLAASGRWAKKWHQVWVEAENVMVRRPAGGSTRSDAAPASRPAGVLVGQLVAASRPPAEPPAGDLGGRTATGTLDGRDVRFQFLPGNKVLIGGDYRGEGTWSLDGAELTLRTGKSHYTGSIKGEKLAGWRIRLDGTELARWDVKFE